MIRYIVAVDGMMCGMCEAHICDVIRRVCPDARKVAASRKRGEAIFLSEQAIDEAGLKKAIADTGYTARAVTSEPFQKRRWLFGK